jgi:4-hydroxybenzoate polyprenyltransferase
MTSPAEDRQRRVYDPISGVRVSDKASFLALPPDEMVDSVRHGGPSAAGALDSAWRVLMLGRPRTCVPGLVAYALGFSYTGAPFSARVVLGALLSLSIGFVANLSNAATDVHEDSRNLPGRVFLVSELGYDRLIQICRVFFALMMLGAIALGAHFIVFMALAVVGLHQYSAPPIRSKGRPLLGLWVFAQAVVFPFLFGWTTAPGDMLSTLLLSFAARITGHGAPPADAAFQSARYLAMWFFLTAWFMAKGAFKNVPDFDGDRAANVRTSATVCPSRDTAAIVATVATITAYTMLAAFVGVGFESPRALIALAWLPVVGWNCARLVAARGGAAGNAILKTDMGISVGFISTLLLLVAPSVLSVSTVVAGAAILFGADFLGVDSRRAVDVASR